MSARNEWKLRFWLTIIVAFLLAYFPHPSHFIMFLCLVAFAILAGWCQNAQIVMQGGKLPDYKRNP